jgi:hypothetical protein
MSARDFDRAELLQMRREPLRVEQGKLARAQSFHQSNKRDLRCISHAMKHGFAKKRAAHRHTVKAAREFSFAPCFNRMRVTELVQSRVALNDLGVDPGVVALRAGPNDFAKFYVDLDLESFPALQLAERMRHMKFVERHDGARIGREPFDLAIIHRHRENAQPITLQQKFRFDHTMSLLAIVTLLFIICR